MFILSLIEGLFYFFEKTLNNKVDDVQCHAINSTIVLEVNSLI